MQTIPVVDFRRFAQEETRASFVDRFGSALQRFGFVTVENHGVSNTTLEDAFSVCRAFFGLPLETKVAYEHPSRGRERGFTSFGVERAKDQAQPDQKEFFHAGHEHSSLPKNSWPVEVDLRTPLLRLISELDAVAMELLRATALYLEEDSELLASMAEHGNSVLRAIHYPQVNGELSGVRAAAHEDINLITLLPPANEAGLQIKTREGKWLDVATQPGQIVVDSGDMLSRITQGKIPSTTHRVVNPKVNPESPRYSIPYFVHPRPDVVLSVLQSCRKPGVDVAPDIGSIEFLEARLRENGVL